jgi:hypothetical protein
MMHFLCWILRPRFAMSSLYNVYLVLGNPRGSGFRNEGYMGGVGKWEDQFASNLGLRWTDPVTARRVPSK